jgi:hypothetical protein
MKPSDFLTELSTEKLAQYKTAAGADATKADSEGNFKRGDKRFKGINTATKKQFDNDAKQVKETVGLPYPGTYEETNDMFKGSGQRRIGSLTTEDEQIDGMAQGEIREIIKNAVHIKNQLDKGVSLDGWMYSFVTVSNDKLNSVAEQINNPNIEEQGVAEGLEQQLVTIYTNPAYKGATVDDRIKKSLPVTEAPFNKLQMWENGKSMKDPKVAQWVNNNLLPKLKQNGKLGPLVVWNNQGKLFVIDGNHRFIAYQTAGYTGNVPVQIVPDKMINIVDTVPSQQGVAEGLDEASVMELSNKTMKQYRKQAQTDIDTTDDAGLYTDSDIDRMGRRSRGIDRATLKIKANKEKEREQGVAKEQHSCPHCGGELVSEELMNEKKDACYYKVKSRYSVWPSAYASGALVKCRKKGADSWGNGGKKNESSILEGLEQVDENLHKWFKEKWVRFGPDGKIRGACARGNDSEGKPKCLPQSKAHNLGKKGRASAASRKRREDPNPERHGKAINVNTKKETKG